MLTVSGRESSNSKQDSDTEMQGSELIRVPVKLTDTPEDPEPHGQEQENLPEQEEPDPNPLLRRSTRSRQPPEHYGQ